MDELDLTEDNLAKVTLGVSEDDLEPVTYIDAVRGASISFDLTTKILTVSEPPKGWSESTISGAARLVEDCLRRHALPPQRKGPPLVLTAPHSSHSSAGDDPYYQPDPESLTSSPTFSSPDSPGLVLADPDKYERATGDPPMFVPPDDPLALKRST